MDLWLPLAWALLRLLSHHFRPPHHLGLLLLSTAAVFENLDSSDVMETPAFPTVLKLLEVAGHCVYQLPPL